MYKTVLFSLLSNTLSLFSHSHEHESEDAQQPHMSLTLSASAVSRNIKNSDYENYGIDGFVTQTNEIPFNKNRGFNLNYAELGVHSTIGTHFNADATFHFHPDAFEIEEAFITTKKLPANLQLKAGSFRSDFGYINSIHLHEQNFVNTPLIYEAMFGVEGLKDPGASLQWIAPTEHYFMAGIETLQGSNQRSFGYPEENNLYVGYIKSHFPLGEYTDIETGGSIAKGKTLKNGESKLYGLEFNLKHTLNDEQSLHWQSEYLYRDKENSKQAGLYTQLMYNTSEHWKIGTRYDAITKNSTNEINDLKRYSAILSYRPLALSQLRLQYTLDKSKSFSGVQKDENLIVLDFIMEIGVHEGHE